MLPHIPAQAMRTLIGVMLIKLATGTISSWGSINLYILSYFYHRGQAITHNTNSALLLLIIVPVSLMILIATKLSNRFGYERTIRVCGFIFMVAPLMIYFSFTLLVMTIFCMFLPASAFAISSIPLINCLWTQFPKSKNKATAVAVIFFGLGGVIWNYLFTFYVNPHNQTTLITDQKTNMVFFSQAVSNKVLPCMKFGCVFFGVLFVVGSFLVRKNNQYQDSEQSKDDIQLRNMALSETFIQPSDPDQIFQKINLSHKKKPSEGQKKSKQKKALKEALLDSRFISIFMISFLTGIYSVFLGMNLKIIFMPIVNDDRFLVYCAISSTVSAILGAFVWGYIADKKNFYFTLLIFSFCDLLIKIYGKFATTKNTIMILFILIGFVDKGMLTLMGPGLVKIFGIETATELLPFKGISAFLSFIIAPLGYIILNSFMGPFQYLFFNTFYSLISVFLAIKLYRNYIESKNK